MSVFDPHSLYIHSNRKTRKGQIIQKRAVDNDYAFNQNDLERSFRILTAYGYYFSRPSPLVKTISFSQNIYFNTDNILDITECINSTIRNEILSIDPSYFSLEPSSINHFYYFINITSIFGATNQDEINLQLYDGTDIDLSYVQDTLSYFSITPFSDSQLRVFFSGLNNPPFDTTVNRPLIQFPTILAIGFDDPVIYEMFYNDDYSSLVTQELVKISPYTGQAVYGVVQFSFTYVNFD